MAQQSPSFKRKKLFLDFIQDVPREKILFVPIDVSKHFHVSMFHDIDCRPLSEFFPFASSQAGFDIFTTRLDHILQERAPQRVIVGMEPTSVYYEGLLQQLRLRYADRQQPLFAFAIVDPATVSHNRSQLSLPVHKSDFIDTAAQGSSPAASTPRPSFLLPSRSGSGNWRRASPITKATGSAPGTACWSRSIASFPLSSSTTRTKNPSFAKLPTRRAFTTS